MSAKTSALIIFFKIPNKRIFDLTRLAAYKKNSGTGGEGNGMRKAMSPPNIFDKFTPMEPRGACERFQMLGWMR